MNKGLNLKNLDKYNRWINSFIKKPENPFWNYIADNISAEDFYLIINILKPEFIKYKGLIFFKDRFSVGSFNNWLQNSDITLSEIQYIFNKFNIYDIFPTEGYEVDNFVFDEIGKFLKNSWREYLQELYPNDNVIVKYSNTDSDYGPTIYIYQEI